MSSQFGKSFLPAKNKYVVFFQIRVHQENQQSCLVSWNILCMSFIMVGFSFMCWANWPFLSYLFCVCFKMSPHSKPFIWRWVLFAWKWTCRRNAFSWMVSFWHTGRRGLWNGLFVAHLSDVLAGNISGNAGKSHWNFSERKIRLDKKP